MSIKYHDGDIFDFLKEPSLYDGVVLPHVVNNCNAMGSGFVIPLMKHFPHVKKSYHNFCAHYTSQDGQYNKKTAYKLLGKVDFHLSPLENNIFGKDILIANMCAQELGGQRPLYYNHLVRCMETVALDIANRRNIDQEHFQIVTVKFGAGLAKGHWDFIAELIHDVWIRKEAIDVTVCVPK